MWPLLWSRGLTQIGPADKDGRHVIRHAPTSVGTLRPDVDDHGVCCDHRRGEPPLARSSFAARIARRRRTLVRLQSFLLPG